MDLEYLLEWLPELCPPKDLLNTVKTNKQTYEWGTVCQTFNFTMSITLTGKKQKSLTPCLYFFSQDHDHQH